ncbi:MAG: DNA polymerase III [Candidatus Sungbacteria bacterium GWC2_49_10]|uniref:PHP domain protein n=2 Tax=Parcubacteria group TaxID=1794811 RepID=A0A0G1WPZ2_9BACT|nr:MAG: polymerase X family protein [Parcubacteria group bacterium GW2011_GWB1_50_9]KKW20928.1 MAG: PHP domain protein [Candidatus Adlerbacteria bacterium GW2011_GWC1_50_9]OGZ92994.1 MAG: DNA polymerase III [Candidatus Sungbacteria bacterium GWC2_49_10]
MTNREVANIFREMAALYDMEGVFYKPRAYENAAASVESFGEELSDIYKKEGERGFSKVPSVGKGIAAHIRAILEKKDFPEHAKLKKMYPVDIIGLTAIEGVGPKMVKTLWKKLKIRTVADLEKAARGGKVRGIEHFGEKTERKILKGISFLQSSGGRRILGEVAPDIRALSSMIKAFPEVERIKVAGSIRRKKETIGDIDILVVSSKPEKVAERFLRLPWIDHVYGSGPAKTNVRLKNGLDADLRIVPEKSFGAALNYFTGSKEHNVALREIAIKKGLKLNEYGLYRGKKMIAGKTEEEVYKALGLRYIEPELREMRGEIEASRKNALPDLIGYGDVKGDLQVQTDWTDGEDSIEAMAHAAIEAGLQYIAITDHTKSLAMTGGADEKKLTRQMEEIARINKKFSKSGFRILTGAEVNIMKDGSLDISDDVLAKLDVVGAAIHSHFDLSRADETKRVIRAMENKNVDIIFHLTGRLINKRESIDIDFEEILKAAKRTGTILEINAFPERADIKDAYIRECVREGVKMSIDSDAHSKDHFKLLEYGIAQARRGWAEKEDIINAWPVKKMLNFLK